MSSQLPDPPPTLMSLKRRNRTNRMTTAHPGRRDAPRRGGNEEGAPRVGALALSRRFVAVARWTAGPRTSSSGSTRVKSPSFVDHADLDRVSAEELIRRKAAAVVSGSVSITGRYPNPGPKAATRRGRAAGHRLTG